MLLYCDSVLSEVWHPSISWLTSDNEVWNKETSSDNAAHQQVIVSGWCWVILSSLDVKTLLGTLLVRHLDLCHMWTHIGVNSCFSIYIQNKETKYVTSKNFWLNKNVNISYVDILSAGCTDIAIVVKYSFRPFSLKMIDI